MAAKSVRIARHVYLRTQQRRLRHVKNLHVRNLYLPDPYHPNPLAISVYFTIHSIHNPSKVLYQSEPVQETYNPSWESVQFTAQQYNKYAALSSFVLSLWVRTGEGEGEEYQVLWERKVELLDLVYLGPFVNKDGSGYPPNSIVFGIFEGYYSYPGVGGVPCPPKVAHSLSDYLPPQSLMEVQKTEVSDSYYNPILMRMLNRQEVLNRAKASARQAKATVDRYREVEKAYFGKRSERERLRTRLHLLRQQLQEQERQEHEERKSLLHLREELDTTEGDLRGKQEDLQRRRVQFEEDNLELSKKRDQLSRSKRNQQLRQRNMMYEVSQAFFIRVVDSQFTICNVILPNADQMDQNSSVEQLGVALGYVAHLVSHVSRILLLPLLYPVKPQGSKSFISDNISDALLIDNITDFPLFAKGSEKALFQYAVHLLSKDIAQIRQHCGYVTSRNALKKTLPNLKSLLDTLTRDVAPSLLPDTSWRMSLPMDTVSLSSYSTADTLSIASTITPYPTTYRRYGNQLRSEICEEGEREEEDDRARREGSPSASLSVSVTHAASGHSANPTNFPMSLTQNESLGMESVGRRERGREGGIGDGVADGAANYGQDMEVLQGPEGRFSPLQLPSKEANVLSINASDDDVQPLDSLQMAAAQQRRYNTEEEKEKPNMSHARKETQLSSQEGVRNIFTSLGRTTSTALEETEMSHLGRPQTPSSQLPSDGGDRGGIVGREDTSIDCTSSPRSSHNPHAILSRLPHQTTDEGRTSLVELQTSREDMPSAHERTVEEDFRVTENDAASRLPGKSPDNHQSVTLIPHELALTLGLTPGDDDSKTEVPHTTNFYGSHPSNDQQTGLLRYAHSSSYSRHFGESGMIKSDVATPHMVSRYGNSATVVTENGAHVTRRARTPAHASPHTNSEPSDSDPQFLEDFIDSSSERSLYGVTGHLRSQRQVVRDRDGGTYS